MYKHIFDYPTATGALIIAGKTAVVYIVLILGLRFLGKRELGQMNIYDLVLIVVLGNAVQNAMINNDNTLGGGIVAAFVLLALNRIFNRVIERSPKIERLMVGQPVLIVNDGHMLHKPMAREGVTKEQVMAALREHGMVKTSDAHMCVLEVDGSISVVPNESHVYRTKRRFRAVRLP
jgi:uncharacterized membrane protein YcaP (DUF421 family)